MESDVNGTSRCERGEEQFEFFYSRTTKKNLVQYDYRRIDGKLFSTVDTTLERCRQKRDSWLKLKS
jgi:hypothetical protein